MRRYLSFILIIILSFSLIAFTNCNESDDFGSNTIEDAYNYPNPFSPRKNEHTTVLVKYNNNDRTSKIKIEVDIYSTEGYKIWTFDREFAITDPSALQSDLMITWGGQNDEGTTVNPGVYIADILVKALEQSSTSGEVVSTGGNVNEKRIRIVVQ